MNTPLLSVLIITYNHENYIEVALKGIINQKTKYPFEIVIGEDTSSDKTRDICIYYSNKYPNIINLLPSEKNTGMIPNFLYTLSECKGKYIAICEGDDYWTDDQKLQKQISFLETNPKYSLCFHNALRLFQDKSKPPEIFGGYTNHTFTQRDIIHEWLIPTASVVFRNVFLSTGIPSYFQKMPVGDFPLFLYLGEFGKYRYVDETMCVYRVLLSGAVKSEFSSDEYYSKSKEMCKILKAAYKPKLKQDFAVRISFDNYCLARLNARRGYRMKALHFMFRSFLSDPFMMLRSRKQYKYISSRRMFPKVVIDIIRGK